MTWNSGSRPPARLVATILIATALPAAADDARDFNAEVDASLANVEWPGMVRLPIGVTPRGTVIWCLVDESVLDYRVEKVRTVCVCGLDGSPDAVAAGLGYIEEHEQRPAIRGRTAYIPIANPDAWGRLSTNAADESPIQPLVFPPEGNAYGSGEAATAAYLWRFIAWFAPDVVIELIGPDDNVWTDVLNADETVSWPDDSLAAAVGRESVAGLGRVPAIRWPARWNDSLRNGREAVREYSGIANAPFLNAQDSQSEAPFSELRKNAVARLDRTPREVAAGLLEHYGDHLNTVMYQPALALTARARFGELAGETSQIQSVVDICEPYFSDREPSLGERASGSHLAGHLVFAELARVTGEPRYVELVTAAADYAFDENGAPREAMPFHSEMSDAVFMACPILTVAGRLTGEAKYFEMAVRHLEFMRDLCVREDGLYRHSPLDEAAWGRGNGFPALGLALSLTDLEAAFAIDDANRETLEPIRDEMLASFRAHIAALAERQDPTGMWRQVIDHPGSYRELTSTCMITFAILRGLRHGWLDEDDYRPIAGRGWEAIKLRIAPDGVLFDVCTGTGKQNTLRDYLDRTAILGRDERGGAMALMVAVEMMEE